MSFGAMRPFSAAWKEFRTGRINSMRWCAKFPTAASWAFPARAGSCKPAFWTATNPIGSRTSGAGDVGPVDDGRDNPFFARAMVNRTWAEFFGTGLVDPVDDMGPHNRPSHPALLDELAQQFAAHAFDVKYLMRAIVLSRPYQLASAVSDPTQGDRRLFARMAPRGLTPDQLKDSLQEANGGPMNVNDNQFGFDFQQNGFDQKFALTEDTAVRYETSIIQALEMMNGQTTTQAASVQGMGQSHLISAVVQNPFMSTSERIETLFLATLTRPPTPEEMERVTKYVEKSPGMDLTRVLFGAVAEAFGNGSAGAKEKDSVAMSDVYSGLAQFARVRAESLTHCFTHRKSSARH